MKSLLLYVSGLVLLACCPKQPESPTKGAIEVDLVDVVRGTDGRAGLMLRIRNGLTQPVVVLHDLKRVAVKEGEKYSVVRRELGEGVEEPIDLRGACDFRGQPALKPGEATTIADFVMAEFQPPALFEVVVGIKFLDIGCSKLLVEARSVSLSLRTR